jgi:phenylacetate-CoA ligase
MAKVRARTDDMLIVRGTNVFPSQVEDILASIAGVTPHYRIVLDNETGMDRMTIMVELQPDAFSDSFEEMNRFRQRVADRLRQALLITPAVKLVEPGGIERSLGKSRRVEDKREKS